MRREVTPARKAGREQRVQYLRRERLRSVLERKVDLPTLRGPVDVDVVIRSLPGMQRSAVVLFYAVHALAVDPGGPKN